MSAEYQAFSDIQYGNISAGRGKDSDNDVPSPVSNSFKQTANGSLKVTEMEGIEEDAVS